MSCIGTFIHCKTLSFCSPEDFDSLRLWEADWQMKFNFNVAKYHSMRVTWHYSHKQIIHDYTLHQQTLENVQSSKYLGITITENMDWGQHISDISSKATKSLAFLEGTWLLHLGVLRRLHTKLWYALNWSMQHPFGALIVKLRFNKWRRYRGRQPAGPAGGGATLEVLAKCSMSCNGQLWRPVGISPLSLSFIKIHCGILSIDKDKYLTLSQSTRSTRSSHNSQYCRPQTYSDALQYSFPQGLFLIGIVWLHLWSQLRPRRTLI